MLFVLSPAKKLDYERESLVSEATEPRFLKDTETLVKSARRLKARDLKAMMGVSDAIAELNVARFKAFELPFTTANARPAIDAFRGDVYVGLDPDSLSDDDRAFAQDNVRILSGLYGVLRPLDLMQAYRLEMGTKFHTRRGETLYAFWGDKLAKSLDADVKAHDAPIIINLASTEYWKSVNRKALKARVITLHFKEVEPDGRARVISFLAKKARGMMARFAVDGRVTEPEALKAFDREGYRFDPAVSTDDDWIFSRPAVGR
ncbi:peroxide stress protein YaaA [Gimibacter soli]|uniref:UPF0246 protein PH603_06200 n=1 Tax=Gimibacter soli TaxID=3024400 RepID=A0AAF0BLD6_9PROT|nr:peroxide stress protein YaaA [Gimibacter soli]WCL55349.1 peroxide stress protein YaaA [Gimibacter soli]